MNRYKLYKTSAIIFLANIYRKQGYRISYVYFIVDFIRMDGLDLRGSRVERESDPVFSAYEANALSIAIRLSDIYRAFKNCWPHFTFDILRKDAKFVRQDKSYV